MEPIILARIAFEAYRERIMSLCEQMVPALWEDLSDNQQEAWERAAYTVVCHVRDMDDAERKKLQLN